ncbi:MAG: hypothetical protein D6679_09555 [Candidatus Hydrogenedentota bacterium]|nr:MAG: hypothetical protein D6679_09555 [Candidatus Hydrogenedentota bacterium]
MTTIDSATEEERDGARSMRRFLPAVLIITLFSGFRYLLGLISQILIARSFGSQPAMDAYVAAVTLPQFISVGVIGSLGIVLLPIFTKEHREKGSAHAWEAASNFLSICIVVFFGFTLLGIFLSRPFLSTTVPGLDRNTLDSSVTLARIVWPSIIGSGLFTILSVLYHAENRFTYVSAVPVVAGTVYILFLLLFIPAFGILGVACASLLGAVIQGVLLLPPLLRRGYLRFHLLPVLPATRKAFRNLLPLLIAGLLARFIPVAERFFASFLPPGRLAQIGYAFRLLSVPAAVIGLGLGTVVFPKLSSEAADTDWGAFHSTLNRALRIIFMPVALSLALLVPLSVPLVRFLFERGSFSPHDTIAVAAFFSLYSFSLFGTGLGEVTGRALYALQNIKVLAGLEGVLVTFYLFFTPILIRSLGAGGLPLAYSLLTFTSVLFHLVFLRRFLDLRGLLRSWTRTLAAALTAFVTAHYLSRLAFPPFLLLLFSSTVSILVFSLILWLFGDRDFRLFFKTLSSFRIIPRNLDSFSHGKILP